jgi:hypothetical protein
LKERKKERVESSSVVKDTSKKVHNELLECMMEVCREKIEEELNEAKFVALVANETSDVSEHLKMVTIFRYETNGNEHERFWGFFNPEGQSAAEISDCILMELNSISVQIPIKLLLRRLMDCCYAGFC